MRTVVLVLLCVSSALVSAQEAGTAVVPAAEQRVYENRLRRIVQPGSLLADYPEFFEPIIEEAHYEAPPLIVDEGADLHVRAWRFSYNARGIIEMPNHLLARETAVIMVHPWAIDDAWGWKSPE